MKKYKLTDKTINVGSRILYQIEALKDFGNVKKGDKGGYVEKEDNLSQYKNCWVYDYAMVFDDAKVYDNAKVYGNAQVYGYALVCDDANVYGNAKVFENAEVSFDAKVYDDAKVYEYGMVQGKAKVRGNAEVCANACIFGDAVIDSIGDYIVFKNFWSSGRSFTWTRSNDMWKVGCFYGTGEELIKKAYKESEISGREYERIVKYVETIKGK